MNYNTKIEELKLKELIETPGNPQEMDKDTYFGLVESFKKKGWYFEKPTVWKRNEFYQIITGHHRILAAIDAGIKKTKMFVIDDDRYTEQQALKDCLEANNRKGKYSDKKLKQFVGKILEKEELKDLTLAGFSENQLKKLLGIEDNLEEKEIRNVKQFVKYGDLIELNNHKLL